MAEGGLHSAESVGLAAAAAERPVAVLRFRFQLSWRWVQSVLVVVERLTHCSQSKRPRCLIQDDEDRGKLLVARCSLPCECTLEGVVVRIRRRKVLEVRIHQRGQRVRHVRTWARGSCIGRLE